MNWKSAQAVAENQGAYSIPNSWLFIHYYEAFCVLFRIENALRVFVYAVLKTRHGPEWVNLNVTSDDNASTTIAAIAKRRIAQASSFGYLGAAINCPIMHLTSGELIRLMTAENEWPSFKPHFLGNREIIKSKLDEIGSVRNALAHFRPIPKDDVAVIKQNAKHVLVQIEQEITQLFETSRLVPTNTPDEWYKLLSTIGIETAVVSLNQSDNQHWITIKITFESPVVKTTKHSSTYITYQSLNIMTPALLKTCDVLRNSVTCVTEDVNYPTIDNEGTVSYIKEIRLTFNRDSLIAAAIDLKQALEDLLRTVSEEIDLLEKDNLARGRLVEVVSTYAYFQKKEGQANGSWSMPNEPFICRPKPDDPPEYWGDHPALWGDYVSSIERFPWMPIAVARPDTPF